MERERKRRWPWIALGLLVLYPLSIGPAARLVLSRPSHPIAIGLTVAFYTPLILVCESTKPTKAWLQRYVRLWAEDVEIEV